MQYIPFQNIPIELSQVVLGTDYFGTTRSREDSFRMMDAYTERGGNVLDTARVYGAWFPGGDGASERTVGAYVKERGLRHKIVISSKAGHPPLDDMHQGRLDRAEITADVDTGLLQLGTDYIDILWLHRDDVSKPVEEIIDTLDGLVKQGKILSYGASNWTAKRLREANAYAAKSGKRPFAASQIQWSLAVCHHIADDTLVQMDTAEETFYAASKLPVFAFSSQAKGFFEKYDKNTLSEKADGRYNTPDNVARYRRLKQISQKTGISLSALALGYLLCNRTFPVLPIIGGSKPEQIADSMSILDTGIPEEILEWRKKQSKQSLLRCGSTVQK
ncbi:MAG TPA: aldo/keto reductase [Candidatus Avimonoglobus intestinipullorum]|uniref:Aldo/keto reductase n=1 Tax=Candidatus Avimonoglobus intestinipullorum TaxID=2840699 RepID=A0A9D1S670_9FIRM|nr:aldo/keto reductase [Candidatus Avimonoglobus intestinipullorum]